MDPPDNLRIRVLTPESTPKNADWLLDGIFAVDDTQVGWGEDKDGIQIYQMRDTSVMYAGATGILSEFAVWFYNVEELAAGGILMVHHLTAFGFDCTRFNQISLPGEVACKVFTQPGGQGAGQFGLAFNHTVAPGEYSFTIVADLPVDAAGNSEELSLGYSGSGGACSAIPGILAILGILGILGPTRLLVRQRDLPTSATLWREG